MYIPNFPPYSMDSLWKVHQIVTQNCISNAFNLRRFVELPNAAADTVRYVTVCAWGMPQRRLQSFVECGMLTCVIFFTCRNANALQLNI